MLFRLIGFVLLMEAGTALAIAMVGGEPFDFGLTWQAVGLLALLLLGAMFIGWLIFGMLASDALDRGAALLRAFFATLLVVPLIVLLTGVGRDWLMIAFGPFWSIRNWWPFLILVVSLAGAQLLATRVPRRVRS